MAAARAADDKKALDVVVLDVGDTIGVVDYFVIASASNDRQVRTIVDTIEERLRTRDDDSAGSGAARIPIGREGVDASRWALLDYGDLVVHVFLDEVRRFYDLERLWADAPCAAGRRAAGLERNAGLVCCGVGRNPLVDLDRGWREEALEACADPVRQLGGGQLVLARLGRDGDAHDGRLDAGRPEGSALFRCEPHPQACFDRGGSAGVAGGEHTDEIRDVHAGEARRNEVAVAHRGSHEAGRVVEA